MSPTIRHPHRSRLIAVTAAVGLTAGTALAIGQSAGASPEPTALDSTGQYIVILNEPPAASYEGGVSGLDATAPEPGEGFRPQSADVRAYQSHLENRHANVARSVDAEPQQQYTVSLNAFTAKLNGTQAAKLQGNRGVLAVVNDEARQLDTYVSPDFLGLTGENGTWNDVGGPNNAGKGVVVGVLDTGIWPENASFAADPLADAPTDEVGVGYRTSRSGTAVTKANGETFTGECEKGQQWRVDLCNQKIISAQYFEDGFVANVKPGDRSKFEFISTRDGNGHGSHTASTAAGNNDVPMAVNGREFGNGSGMAPGAQIAAYKVCWEDTDPDTGGCFTSDIVAAIDQAVTDNVDVINFSISGAIDTLVDPVELAFLSAASANVFVSASAGNSGPDVSTVAHNAPWLTTVAATTHINYLGTVELGNGDRFRGAMLDDVGVAEQTPLVNAGDIPASGVDPADAALCLPDSIDAAGADGTIVVCDRGTNARVEKSQVVADAGGVGMVLGNVADGESLDADFHSVPSVHLAVAEADNVRQYVADTDAPTAAILPGDQTGLPEIPVPVRSGFSSRGPALANDGDLLKPDIGAPGSSVLAAVAPGPNGGNDYNLISGTSMAAPHAAGLGALIKGEKTNWTPMQVKSAMMTTATDVFNEDGSVNDDHFDTGAGNVDPTRFLEPGLTYDSGVEEWLAFLEGTGVDTGTGIEAIDPSDLNQPSIAIGALAGTQTVTRSVTAETPGMYRAEVDVPGFDVTVQPSVLNFSSAGDTKEFTVTFDRADAELGTYAQGSLTWSGDNTTVESPIAVKPVAVAAPSEVVGSGASGSIDYDVVSGVDGDVDVSVAGLVPGEVSDGSVTPGSPADPAGNESSHVVEFEVPEGTTLARFDLVSALADADLDLYILDAAGRLISTDGITGSASERVDLFDPEPGTYRALVHAFSTADGGAVDFSLRNFALGSEDAGNATFEPDPISGSVGQTVPVSVSWSGLDAGIPYLGAVTYEGLEQPTIVAID